MAGAQNLSSHPQCRMVYSQVSVGPGGREAPESLWLWEGLGLAVCFDVISEWKLREAPCWAPFCVSHLAPTPAIQWALKPQKAGESLSVFKSCISEGQTLNFSLPVSGYQGPPSCLFSGCLRPPEAGKILPWSTLNVSCCFLSPSIGSTPCKQGQFLLLPQASLGQYVVPEEICKVSVLCH